MVRLRLIEGNKDKDAPPQQTQPILAINDAGTVVRANFPARKALTRAGSEPEGRDLGNLLADALNPNSHDNVVLTMHDRHGAPIEVRIVLSNEEMTAKPEPVPQTPSHTATDVKLIDFIAHELRNPMGTVLGLSRVLENRLELLSTADQISAIQSIHDETERALLILNGILKLAEGRASRAPVGKRVPLHTVLNRIVTSHRRQNPHRSLVITGDAPLFALGNSMWIELAVGNLLSNAEKYTAKDRDIEIAFHQNGSTVAVVVMDRGDGMPAERYGKLWDLYERGAAGNTLDVSGSGIGLALCKELMEDMGGQVWAGPRDGGGSVFALTLPAALDTLVPEALSTRLSNASADEGAYSYPQAAWAA
jgi:signal transduction histidine kinase